MDEPVPDAPEPQREPDVTVVRERAPLWRRIVKWTAIALAGVVALAGAGLIWLDTPWGHAFVARQINNMVLENGLNLRVGKIEGSLYGETVLRDVKAHDPKGVFARAESMTLDWRPFSYLGGRIDIRALTSPEIKVDRLPAFNPVETDPNAPLIPDIQLDVGKLEVARIDLAPGVAGERHLAQVSGSAHLSDGRAQLTLNGGTLSAPGIAGGDRVAIKLDAVPKRNQLDIDMRVNAPAGGLVAGLAGLESPLTLSVAGDGDWQRWSGKAVGTLGGAELTNLALQAQDGLFRVRGTAQPGLIAKGPVAELTAPALDISLDAKWSDRRADTRLSLRSDAMQVEAAGIVDMARNRFGNLRIEAMLKKPAAIAPNVRGDSVRGALLLNGPFATPVVDYKLQAASIGFGDTVIQGLVAEGKTQVDADRIMVPVRAHAARITGLDAAAGGRLTDISITGDLAVSGDQILSDNLRLRSDRIDATAVLIADMSSGRYTGALKGRVNDYRIDGLALVNLTTDAKLIAPPGGGWGIEGQVAARSSQIYSEGLRSFLGGNATASARVRLDADGVINFSQLAMKAPQFTVTGGSGRYTPEGALLVDANAQSKAYGPLTARITGTVDRPTVLLRAEEPGLGVGLAGLEATIKGDGGRYAVDAKGSTDYGEFTADVLVSTGTALSVDVRRARFAGMDFTGKLDQVAAGPFAGRLEFTGSGVRGHADLSAEGKLQRATFDARANNAAIPGVANLTIGRAIATGSILLGQPPEIEADVQIAKLRSKGFALETARAKINYVGGSGSAQVFANGASGVPFRVAAAAKLSPKQWLVAAKGVASGVGFHTDGDASIRIDEAGYRLEPTRIDFDQGSAVLDGTYGTGMALRARLESLDLALFNVMAPGLGLGGSATGAVDFEQANPSAFPSAQARLEIKNFSRTSISTVSSPVDMSFTGKLLPDGGDARMLIRRGSTTIGRVVATLRPLGPQAGPWTERLMEAPLSGGIRYNGPSAVIFSLAGLSDQQLSGPIGVAADFGGRVEEPELTGIVKASNLVYENETYGTRLSNLKLGGRFSNTDLVIEQLDATAGEGTVSASGKIGLSSAQGFPIDLTAKLNDARLARSDSLAATATGTIRIQHGPDGGEISGELTIPEARYAIILQGAAEVPQLTGVRRKGDAPPTEAQRRAAAASVFALKLTIRANDRLFVSGMGLESEWGARINVGGTSTAPVVDGTATLVRGTYEFAGHRFDLSNGTIRFGGSRLSNPTIDIAGTTTAEGVTAILNVSGTAERPRISFTSSPALPQEEVLSRILFGSSVTNLSATEALQLAAAINSLRGSGGGLNPLGKLRSATGIDRLRIVGADEATGRGTSLSAGKYITDDIYIEIITDARGYTATQLEIALSRALSVLSQAGSFGGSSVSIKYSKDY